MRRLATGLCVVLAAWPAAAVQQQPAIQRTVVGVQVPFSVWRDGQPVRDLQASDIVLTDNGVRQEITVLDGANMPLDVTIVFQEIQRGDHVRGTFGADVQAAVTQSVRAGDRVGVMLAGDDQREHPFPPPPDLFTQAMLGGRCWPTYDALARAFVRRSDPDRQRVIVLLTTYEGTGSVLSFDAVLDLARRSSARLYVATSEPIMNPPAPNSPRIVERAVCSRLEFDWSEARRAQLRQAESTPQVTGWEDVRAIWLLAKNRLAALAEATGGRSLDPTLVRSSFAPALRAAFDEVRASYLLGYTPAGVSDTGWHRLEVTITRPGRYQVRVRPGYQR